LSNKAPVGGGWYTEADGPKKWVLEWAHEMKRERLSQGLTQEDIAEMSGVSKDTVSRYESLDRMPSLGKAMAISDVLGMGIEW